jgi:hypothetical protein
MIEGIRGNFNNLYKGDKGKCGGCGTVQDTQAHVVECSEFLDLREVPDLGRAVTW